MPLLSQRSPEKIWLTSTSAGSQLVLIAVYCEGDQREHFQCGSGVVQKQTRHPRSRSNPLAVMLR